MSACAAQGCGREATRFCSYADRQGQVCGSGWCEDHIERVGEADVCRRHRLTAEIIGAREGTVFEISPRPPVADRALSLASHLALVMSASAKQLLEAQLGAWPDAHVEADQHPRPYWDEHGALMGWELGWSIRSPRRHHLRVAVRARSGSDSPAVQVVAEHLVAYDGEPSPEAVRGRQTEAQLRLLREIEGLLAEALTAVPAGWQTV